MVLNELHDEDLAWLGAIGEKTPLTAGTVLIADGATESDVFILITARAAVVALPGAIVARLGPGDIVGELSLIDGQPASATVILTAAGEVMRLSRAPLLNRLATGDRFAFAFHRAVARVLAARLRGTNQRVAQPGDPKRVLDRLRVA